MLILKNFPVVSYVWRCMIFKSPSTLVLCTLPFIGLGQISDLGHYFDECQDLMSRHVADGLVDYETIRSSKATAQLVDFIAQFDYTSLTDEEEKAYLINTYNVLVIHGVCQNYPLNSLLKIFGFFDQQKWKIGPQQMTLDDLEKGYLLKKYPDPRLHFALACGAKGCPPLAETAFRPETVEAQLDERTTSALNDEQFIKGTTADQIGLNQIFNWYAQDFGGNKGAILRYINNYRQVKIDDRLPVQYYPYDWSLNDKQVNFGANNASRYVVSAAIPQGGYELKWFNNLYSQIIPKDGNNGTRESFFTSIINFVYGVVPRLNVGFDIRYRAYTAHATPASALKFFSRDAVQRFLWIMKKAKNGSDWCGNAIKSSIGLLSNVLIQEIDLCK